MVLQVGADTVIERYVGAEPVIAVYLGEQKVHPYDPLTITNDGNDAGWDGTLSVVNDTTKITWQTPV